MVPGEPSKPDDIFRFRINPIVTGNTPAFSVTSQTSVNLSSEAPPRPDWDSIPLDPGTVISAAVTSRSFGSPALVFSDADEFATYTNDGGRFYLWNRIYYCDAFRRLHWIESSAFHSYGSEADVQFFGSHQTTDSNDGDDVDPRCESETPQAGLLPSR